jgi:hypothetical protein
VFSLSARITESPTYNYPDNQYREQFNAITKLTPLLVNAFLRGLNVVVEAGVQDRVVFQNQRVTVLRCINARQLLFAAVCGIGCYR